MNTYQKSKKIIYENAKSIGEKLESEGIRKIKRITIIIFAALIALDVIFVLPNPFPTFSRVVLDSSPTYIFIIWLWGIMTANIFFPRKVKFIFRVKLIGLVLMIIIGTGLYLHGHRISEMASELDCSAIDSNSAPAFAEIICYNLNDSKIDCFNANGECNTIKYDITTTAKLSLLIFGVVFGYFLWPQLEREPSESSS